MNKAYRRLPVLSSNLTRNNGNPERNYVQIINRVSLTIPVKC